jgi:hypothetical protein
MKVTKEQALATLLVLLTVITLASASLAAYNYFHLKTDVVQNCEEIEVVKAGVRKTIEKAAQQFSNSSPVRGETEKKATEKYYNEVLATFAPKKCEGR